MKKMRNRVAFVTGAGQGMGKAIALRMAREGAQLAVFLASDDAAYITGGALDI